MCFTDKHTLVSYAPKKNRNVILMSALPKDKVVSTTEDREPLMIQDYSRNNGGVDCLDKVMYSFIHHAFYFIFIYVKHSILCKTDSILFPISYLLFLSFQLTGTYTCKRMTARWPVAVFRNILDVSISDRPDLESGEVFQEESFGDSFNSTAPADCTHLSSFLTPGRPTMDKCKKRKNSEENRTFNATWADSFYC